MGQTGRSCPPATYEDLLQVPDRFVAEIVDGELHTSPQRSIRIAQRWRQAG